jgi:hypothetical protein
MLRLLAAAFGLHLLACTRHAMSSWTIYARNDFSFSAAVARRRSAYFPSTMRESARMMSCCSICANGFSLYGTITAHSGSGPRLDAVNVVHASARL